LIALVGLPVTEDMGVLLAGMAAITMSVVAMLADPEHPAAVRIAANAQME